MQTLSTPIAALSLSVFLAACGPIPPPTAAAPDAPSDDDERGPPLATLSCVTEVLPDTFDRVLRVEVAAGVEGEAFLTVREGPLFAEHVGRDRDLGGEPLVRSVSRIDDATFDDGRGLRLALVADGLALRGTLVDDQCYARTELPVVCWNEATLIERAAAHYDPVPGRCVDQSGADAHNAIPVEVVRETGFGECADLRGALLNGSDYGHPTLDGWLLAGARLDDAQLFFANLVGATLDGARFDTLSFGYAQIEGSVDVHSVLPLEDGCVVGHAEHGAATSISCHR